MKLLLFFIFIIIVIGLFSIASCRPQRPNLIGAWEFTCDENCEVNFLGLEPYVYPYIKYGHKIYFTDSLFYNPFLSNKDYEYLPFDAVYTLKDGKVYIAGLEPIEISVQDSLLLLEREGCKLNFRRVVSAGFGNDVGIEVVSFSSRSDDDIVLDSFQVHRDKILRLGMSEPIDDMEIDTLKYIKYIFRLAESIDSDDLDKVFDSKVSDTNKYTIELLTETGNVHKIVSYGKYETPFEVKTLAHYLLEISKTSD